jgi:rhamnogalacturonyl hydrolase YesR
MKIRTLSLATPTLAALLWTGLNLSAQPVVSTTPGPGDKRPMVDPVLNQATLTTAPSDVVKPMPILEALQRVADWQLAHPSFATNRPATGWVQAAGDAGFMALAGISGDAKYREAMLAMGETNHWDLGSRRYDADDYCIGQTWAELYALYRAPKMIAPLRERFDDILAHPSTTETLKYAKKEDPKARENWAWADSLFMGPPAWMRLYAVTGDERYLNFAVTNWWRSTEFLYDKEAHLFFRDSTYFNKKEANGQKVFWGRGNGWVMAGLVRVMESLPANHPDRPRFEQLFKMMADKILTCQQPDGLWRASLLDPDSYPLKETSGSGFYTYALAWGVNQGLLEREKFSPAVHHAWSALVACVAPDGKLTCVQPIGANPKSFASDTTEVYGTGAFLLAGSEVYRLAVTEAAMENGAQVAIPVKVSNPAAFWREGETVEISLKDAAGCWTKMSGKDASAMPAHWVVMDGFSARVLPSQVYAPEAGADELIFQVDLAPGETRTYYLLAASAVAAVPPPLIKTFARYVPERYDDFAWESDRIAHRAYGQALIPVEHTITSGPDVWIKKDRRLIVDVMYATKHYHEDNGEFMDDYRVGHSCGCGGLGIWDGVKLHTSSNYQTWKLITSGPIRSEFELTYEAWDAGRGRKVSETKRYSIDAGSWFTHAQSTFASEDGAPLTLGVGLAERACPTNREEFITHDLAEGWTSYWQPEDKPKGVIGVAMILPKDSVLAFTNDAPKLPDSAVHAMVPQPTHEGYPPIRNLLAIAPAEVGKPFGYYFGATWDRSGDFTNHIQWDDCVRRFAERRDQPLRVALGN